MSYCQLNRLPIEIYYIIFSYLKPFEISYSFSNLNQFLNEILNGYDLKYSIDFYLISFKELYSLKQHIHPEHVIHLSMQDDEKSFKKIKYFLSKFNLKFFVNLRSIHISFHKKAFSDMIFPCLSSLPLNHLTKLSIHDYGTNNSLYELITYHGKSLRELSVLRASILNRNIFPKNLQKLKLYSADNFYLRTILQRLNQNSLIKLHIRFDEKPIIDKLFSSFQRHYQSLTYLFIDISQSKSIHFLVEKSPCNNKLAIHSPLVDRKIKKDSFV
ncbi:unnamed protein product [Adineta steineri]|uniref:F-box domain-containing protein n=1 Tax=Adineta steineri TaxID=433720 RepID=A0A814ZHD9_9BILA|nr:unnamed protein product [Adineta steineri]CAF1542121.1 unnamed protein product [Adineta steineri]